MRTIRKGTFETNSSSTHSIAIPKKKIETSDFPKRHIHFGSGRWDWQEDCETDSASYLYTAIVDGFEAAQTDAYLEKLKAALDRNGVEYSFDPLKVETFEWRGEPYSHYVFERHYDDGIDHACECEDMIDALLADDDLLMRYLFGGTMIYTGNDNSCDDECMCCCAFEDIYPDGGLFPEPNPNHHPDEYDYFFKGN